MTSEQCARSLATIRKAQGTARPSLRVDFAGATYEGRLARVDSDPDRRPAPDGTAPLLVLEGDGREIVLQIAAIPVGGIHAN